ncbi:hypothetical protein N7475_009414 [Penicillium sp. IBT 31633x]|nr:hypothetical protein N7475_009414 [Penicillium sp. IBT 31633x]
MRLIVIRGSSFNNPATYHSVLPLFSTVMTGIKYSLHIHKILLQNYGRQPEPKAVFVMKKISDQFNLPCSSLPDLGPINNFFAELQMLETLEISTSNDCNCKLFSRFEFPKR